MVNSGEPGLLEHVRDGDPGHARADDDNPWIPPLGHAGTLCPLKAQRQELGRLVLVVVLAEQFFGVVVGVGAGLSAVEVCGWEPFGVAVGVFAGGPALFGEWVVGTAGQAEVVDVGDGVGGVGIIVVDLAPVGRHRAAGEGAATISGVQHNSLGG